MAKKTSTRKSGASKAATKSKSAGKPKVKTRASAKATAAPKSKSKSKAKPAAKSASKPAAKPRTAAKSKPKSKPKSKLMAKSKPNAVKSTAKSKPVKAAKPAPAAAAKPKIKPRHAAKPANVKISKPPATAIAQHPVEHPEPPTLAELRKANSGLSRQEKEQYRKVLMEKRSEILGDVASLKDAALSSNGNLSNMPLHMADVGSDQYEQESMLGLVESERRLLREINDALVRLHEGTYGVCVESGKPIGKQRLDATPWAKYTIEVVREKERMGGRR